MGDVAGGKDIGAGREMDERGKERTGCWGGVGLGVARTPDSPGLGLLQRSVAHMTSARLMIFEFTR